jgi:hypothetical protein
MCYTVTRCQKRGAAENMEPTRGSPFFVDHESIFVSPRNVIQHFIASSNLLRAILCLNISAVFKSSLSDVALCLGLL